MLSSIRNLKTSLARSADRHASLWAARQAAQLQLISPPNSLQILKMQSFSGKDLPMLMECMHSRDPEKQLFGVVGLSMLIRENKDYEKKLIEAQITPLLQSLIKDDSYIIREETLYLIALLTKSSARNTQVLKNLVPHLYRIWIQRQKGHQKAILAIANIMLDHQDIIIFLINHGIVSLILSSQPTDSQIWCLRVVCICYSKVPQEFDRYMNGLISLLSTNIRESYTAQKKMIDTLWTICELARHKDWICPMLSYGIVNQLVTIVLSRDSQMMAPCIEALCMMTLGTEAQISQLFKQGILDVLNIAFDQDLPQQKTKAYWCLSNLASFSTNKTSILLQRGDILSRMRDTMLMESSNLRYEVAHTYLNIICTSQFKQMAQWFANYEVLKGLLLNLDEDTRVGVICLKGLKEVLVRFIEEKEELGWVGNEMIEKLDRMQMSPSSQIFREANQILQILDVFSME